MGASVNNPGPYAYVFRREGVTWVPEAKLRGSGQAGGDILDDSVFVSIDGELLVVASPQPGAFRDLPGFAYVFRREGTTWVEEVRLTSSGSQKNDLFGQSVSLRNDIVAVGAPGENHLEGRAYVFKRQNGSWIEETVLTGSQIGVGDSFGRSVSLSGERLLVGAPIDDHAGFAAGSVYVFRRQGQAWVEEARLVAADAAPNNLFGDAVSLDGDFAAVGADGDDDVGSASGSTYIFRRSLGTWVPETKLVASDGATGDRFGSQVALDGGLLLVGAPEDDDAGDHSGSVYRFAREEGSWTFAGKLLPPPNSSFFGAVLSLHNYLSAIRSRVYALGPDCNANALADPCDVAEGTSADCDGNAVPDECQPDCNGNAVADACDIRDGTSGDCNQNGVPDDCDLLTATGKDGNHNGIPDECEQFIPALSAWGLLILGLLLMACAKLRFRRKRNPSVSAHATLLLGVAILFGTRMETPTFAQAVDLTVPHHPEHILVRFRGGTSALTRASVHDAIGATELNGYHVEGLYLVRVSPDRLAGAIAEYLERAEVLYAEPDYELEPFGVPNDPGFAQQWGLQNTGQIVDGDQGTPGADIRAVPAWDIHTGSSSFRIAIIDASGVDYEHDDLAGNFWTNSPELNGTPNFDDDGNDYIDDVHGYDWGADPDDGDPRPGLGPTQSDHGTQVAGIIGAVGHNALGVTGVNWECDIVALKVSLSSATFVSHVCNALTYCVANQIKVSNNSYGCGNLIACPPGEEFVQGLTNCIGDAGVAIGHIFVASAGNAGANTDLSRTYPASLLLDNIISVGGVDNDDKLGIFTAGERSNYGLGSVDLAAPSVNVYTTFIHQGFPDEPGPWPLRVSVKRRNFVCRSPCCRRGRTRLEQISDGQLSPDATYEIQAIHTGTGCSDTNEAHYSPALSLTTSRWGDVVGSLIGGAWTVPDGVVTITSDAIAVSDKFSNRPTAPVKARPGAQ